MYKRQVIGYAYDGRWGTMKAKDFIKRRIIRLHPMVVMGAIIGAIMFYFQGCSVSVSYTHLDVYKRQVNCLCQRMGESY